MAESRRLPDTNFIAVNSGAALRGPVCAFERVVTDSRDAAADTLFVCLAGERVDGHHYIPQALDAGCRAFLVSAQWMASANVAGLAVSAAGPGAAPVAVSFVVAESVLGCLQAAAGAWRRFCQAEAALLGHQLLRVGITGSSGKTTVKEMVAAILLDWKPGVKNPGNLNSDIGLAASLFLLRPEHQVAVFELGINRPGEMDELAAMFEPDCALITNIGTAHIGVLGGTRQAIANEKKKICKHFSGSQVLFYHEEDDFREFLMRGVQGRVISFGPRSLAGFSGARSLGVEGWEISYIDQFLRVSLPGAHNLLNALAAVSVAEYLQVPLASIVRGLESVSALSGRSELLRVNGLTIINDCYNANADSMLKAIEMCDSMELSDDGDCRRLVYVLGSMKELGASSEEVHRRVGQAAATSRAAVVAFYGEETRVAWQEALEIGHQDAAEACTGEQGHKCLIFSTDFEDFAELVCNELRPGDLVLIKASRSMALERITAILAGGEGADVS
ncbi:MAG: UDP-N-acetylmuramoyl-tripeptide--D-alanyl-D-alanine ligase [Spirochaetes bacterium]|nr:UDP-N-acetylmuramoyl-tripeptide--D-alanyl-D-alanine ligase [Spirochaetota bacterium]MBU0955896.1 UDP-N-acetylmuramoyl-tripeptide--D-alanyl-D-alanine ligase [Spirochaetota bacterium]